MIVPLFLTVQTVKKRKQKKKKKKAKKDPIKNPALRIFFSN